MKKDQKLLVSRLKELQNIQAYFCYLNSIKNTPELLLGYLFEEMRELDQAIKKHDAKAIQNEIADIIIFIVSLINLYPGVSLEEVITQKLERNFHKYNPALPKELKKQGLASSDLLQQMKNLWDRNKDKNLIK